MQRSITRTHVPPHVELHARQMRSALAPSEQKLWEAIRGGRLGACFRRQVPLGRFIADFAAPSVRLVIEVDGGYHQRRRSVAVYSLDDVRVATHARNGKKQRSTHDAHLPEGRAELRHRSQGYWEERAERIGDGVGCQRASKSAEI